MAFEALLALLGRALLGDGEASCVALDALVVWSLLGDGEKCVAFSCCSVEFVTLDSLLGTYNEVLVSFLVTFCVLTFAMLKKISTYTAKRVCEVSYRVYVHILALYDTLTV